VRESAELARHAAVGSPARHTWPLALALSFLLSGLVVLAFSVKPTYRVYLGETEVAASRRLSDLAAAVQARVDEQLGQPIVLAYGEKEWSFTRGQLGLLPAKPAAEAVQEAAALVPWWQRNLVGRPALRLTGLTEWDQTVLGSALGSLRAEVETEPIPATFEVVDKQPVITPETNGTMVETHAVLAALEAAGGSAKVDLPVSARASEVTKQSLEGMGIRKLVAEWSTMYDPTIPRADNVERAARAFNGLIVKPGDILSYNATVGPVDSANGWREAFVIVGGELVPGVGGGVCQTATTLYGAALRANLEIVERHQHQLAVSYIDPSQDAAIAQGWEDLKIRNTSGGHLYL